MWCAPWQQQAPLRKTTQSIIKAPTPAYNQSQNWGRAAIAGSGCTLQGFMPARQMRSLRHVLRSPTKCVLFTHKNGPRSPPPQAGNFPGTRAAP